MKKYLWEILFAFFLIFALSVFYTQSEIGKKQDLSWTQSFAEYRLAESYLKQKLYPEALNNLEKLLSDPQYHESVNIHWLAGNACIQLGRFDQAESHFLTIRKVYPAVVLDSDYLKDYAVLKLNQGDSTTAKRYLEKFVATKSDPELKKWAKDILKSL